MNFHRVCLNIYEPVFLNTCFFISSKFRFAIMANRGWGALLGRATELFDSHATRVRTVASQCDVPGGAHPGWHESAQAFAHDLQDSVQLMMHSASGLGNREAVRADPEAARHLERISSNVRRLQKTPPKHKRLNRKRRPQVG